MRPRLALAAVIVALPGGCGSDGGPAPNDKEQVRAVVTRWLEAWQENDGGAACSLMTPDRVRRAKESGRTCEKETSRLAQPFPGTPKVGEITIEGPDGMALIRDRVGETPIAVAQVRGEWLVGTAGQTRLRPQEVL